MRVATLRSTAWAAGVRLDLAKRNSTSLLSETVEWCGVSVSMPAGLPTVATSLDVVRARPLVVVLDTGGAEFVGVAPWVPGPIWAGVGAARALIGTCGTTGPPWGNSTSSALTPAGGAGNLTHSRWTWESFGPSTSVESGRSSSAFLTDRYSKSFAGSSSEIPPAVPSVVVSA